MDAVTKKNGKHRGRATPAPQSRSAGRKRGPRACGLRPTASNRWRFLPSLMTSGPKRRTVVLNIPYDAKFERLYLAFIAGLTGLGLDPRCVLEIPPQLEGCGSHSDSTGCARCRRAGCPHRDMIGGHPPAQRTDST